MSKCNTRRCNADCEMMFVGSNPTPRTMLYLLFLIIPYCFVGFWAFADLFLETGRRTEAFLLMGERMIFVIAYIWCRKLFLRLLS